MDVAVDFSGSQNVSTLFAVRAERAQQRADFWRNRGFHYLAESWAKEADSLRINAEFYSDCAA